MTTVSICIPVYENYKGLDRLLESIKIQTFLDFEVIITDDSIENNCHEIVNKYYQSNLKNKITYFKNKINLGSPKNWNKALNLAKGKYIKLMHHDDSFANKFALEIFISEYEKNSNSSFIASSSINYRKNKILKINIIDQKNIIKLNKTPESIFLGNIIGSPSVIMWKRTNVMFNESLIWLVDVEFYYKMLTKKNFHYIKTPLININEGEIGQISNYCLSNYSLIINENLKVFSEIKEKNKYSREFESYWLKLFQIYSIKYLNKDMIYFKREKSFFMKIIQEYESNKIKNHIIHMKYLLKIYLKKFY